MNPIPLTSRRLILGLDIGGTKLAAGVLDSAGRLLSWQRTATTATEGPDAVLQRLATVGFQAIASAGLQPDDLDAIGIGCGGPLDAKRGIVISPPNLPGWRDVPVTERMRGAFGLPAWLDNDGNAGVLGETRFGAARGCDDVVFMTVSTGVGGGVISGGRVVHGASGNAAELGHLCIAANGRRCGCGARGCLEAYASGTSIAARAREAIEAGDRSSMTDLVPRPDLIAAETVVMAARNGDALARRIWAETIDALAVGIASAIHAFNPQIVVLGGGVTAAGEFLFEPLRARVAEQTMPELAKGLRIVPSSLGEELGVFGAAAIALDRLVDEPAASPRKRRNREMDRGGTNADERSARIGPRLDEPAAPGSFERRVPRSSAARDPRAAGESPAASAIDEHIDVARVVGERLATQIDEIGELLCAGLARGGRLIAFGNGGSAADAQHFVAELIGHYKRERAALPALALTTDSSVLTAIANDYSFADVFARQVEALAGPDDVVFGISTSGNAQNVIRGLLAARLRGAATVALTGGTGGSAARVAAHALVVPSSTTARIQEMHTLIVHLISDRVDEWAASLEIPARCVVIPMRRGAQSDGPGTPPARHEVAPPAPRTTRAEEEVPPRDPRMAVRAQRRRPRLVNKRRPLR